ncbi:hypothetical protein V9T40_003763 [Parthenolecanium corni]|uniref:nicotinamidase n=1 Tax=Parthenolecanium corni TaxID=536013 RepID=A0AAN9U1F4_9HEMI
MNACFSAFDKDGDGLLSFEEFGCVCKALFRNDDGIVYGLEDEELRDVFDVFDLNKDGFIDSNEFTFCWNKWIKVIVRPICAFLIVDVQNDFISGSLNISNCPAQQNGLDVIEPINRLLDAVQFEVVYYSLDWHPPDHISFIDNLHLRPLHSSSPISAENAQVYDTVIFEGPPIMEQKLWPRHCVQNTWGAELNKNLRVVDNAIKVTKGSSSEIDSYSVFWDNMKLRPTSLVSMMEEKNITDLFICGIAYDVCVNATVKDSLSAGYRTILLDDCSRGIDAEDIEKTKSLTIENHGVVINSSQVCDTRIMIILKMFT